MLFEIFSQTIRFEDDKMYVIDKGTKLNIDCVTLPVNDPFEIAEIFH